MKTTIPKPAATAKSAAARSGGVASARSTSAKPVSVGDPIKNAAALAKSVPEPFRANVVRVAKSHFRIVKGVDRIHWFPDNEGKAIRFVEINRDALPTANDYSNVLVYRFRPSGEVLFPVHLGDVLPEEWPLVESGKLGLPNGWDLRNAIVFERPLRAARSGRKG